MLRMKNTFYLLLISLIITSCLQNDSKQKEVDLKQKDVELKEKQPVSDIATNANQNTSKLDPKQVQTKDTSITVPISLDELIIKLGKNYKFKEADPDVAYYVWKFRNGLEISASDEDEKIMFSVISFSARSNKAIPSCPYCPFGFVLNQTSFNEVKSRFSNKLRKLEHRESDDFKAYSDGKWNYFYFKNQILKSIEIATFEVDMTN